MSSSIVGVGVVVATWTSLWCRTAFGWDIVATVSDFDVADDGVATCIVAIVDVVVVAVVVGGDLFGPRSV